METSNQQERLESLKAGIVAAIALFLSFISTSALNNLFLAYFPLLIRSNINLHWWHGATALISGFLFGITYRYIIREDRNLQLQAGAVLAFGLVRGLAQLDIGVSISGSLPCAVLAIESILWFGMSAIALNLAITRGWIKAFKSN